MIQQRSSILRRAIPLAATGLVLLAACGDDESDRSVATDPPSTEAPSTTAAPTTEPPITEPPDTGFTVPTGADDVVVSYWVGGGLTTQLDAFQNTPSILVTGDGRVIVRGSGSGDGPTFMPELTVRTITPEGIQQLIAAAAEAGLLQDVEYESSQTIADAPSTAVVLAANDEVWTHAVYALGFYDPIDEVSPEAAADQMALEAFIERLRDLESLVGADQLGPEQPYRPDSYLVSAVPIAGPSDLGYVGTEFEFADWPADASVRLADAATCVAVDGGAVADLVESAGLFTIFVDDGQRYEVFVKHGVPGADC